MGDTVRNVLSVLGSTPKRWIHLAESIPPDLLRRPAAPGEWSALECLSHMVDTERLVFPARVGHLLRGEDFPAFHPDEHGRDKGEEPSPVDLANEFDRLRADGLRLVSRIRPGDLGRKARHQELGIVTLEELIHEWAGHDLMHTVQGERAILQPFIAGCGPWKRYFSDHLAGNGGKGTDGGEGTG